MRDYDPRVSFAQKVVVAIHYTREQRSRVNDVFYFSSLKHLDKAYLDANIIPVDIAEKIREGWIECYKSICQESFSLNAKAKEHLSFWSELLMLPNESIH
ncbi:hypothetical protein ACRXCV_15215 [Halobacteriovorax sp. GFR7]|uniref:hypothetical protein n=1 Tax=unclassified Halobacteriovorax TaxID=2639665 RepID=UPI003D97468F